MRYGQEASAPLAAIFLRAGGAWSQGRAPTRAALGLRPEAFSRCVQPKNGGFPVTFFALLPLQQAGGGEISNLSPAVIVLLSQNRRNALIRLHSSCVHHSSLLVLKFK